jgi:TetR/AcrR family transcriptional repressor of nem operon
LKKTFPTKGEITRNKVLKSAQRLFFLNGYHRTSVDDILRDSKVKKGNFYFHFKSKEALGYAVIDLYSAFFRENLNEMIQGNGTSIGKILSFFSKGEKHLAKNGCLIGCPFGNFALEMSDVHDGFRERVDQIFDEWAHQMNLVLREGKQKGEIRKEVDTKALSHLLVAVAEGATLLVKAKKNTSVYRACARSLRAMLEHSQV